MIEINECWNEILEMVFPSKPNWTELNFTRKAWLKLQCYINLIGDYEITGFGRVVDNTILDVKILKQTVKSSTVDCDVDAMMDFLKAIPKDQTGQWILDWHSHVKMGTFASGTDSANYKEQFEARLRKQFPYIIVNQQGSVYARCYINPNKETEIKVGVIQDDITKEELLELYEECKKDIEENCSKPEYKTTTYSWGDDYDWGKYYGYNSKNKLSTSHSGESCCKKHKKKDTNSEGTHDDRTLKQLILDDCDDSDYSTRYSNSDDDDFCISCHTYLADAIEYDRGICDDCWEKLTPSEQMDYINSQKGGVDNFKYVL